MRTTATNRKLRFLITGIKNHTLIPNPEFQRRLVWTNRDKMNFLDTVLSGYPFPEIYIAAGEVNPETGEGTEMLVDGQQRITTLYHYFIGSNELKLGSEIKPYAELSSEEKIQFLEYEVVVRDLGKMNIQEIKRVFERINATSYSLNAIEVHNSRYEGAFKAFAEEISQVHFFNNHRIFSFNDIRRMKDLEYVLVVIITIMSTYFNRDDELEVYLRNYNDEFDLNDYIYSEIKLTLHFIDACVFDNRSRAWKKSDLLTLIVEIHRLICKQGVKLDPLEVGSRIKSFYEKVNQYVNAENGLIPSDELQAISDYAKAASQATNDKGSRVRRGQVLQKVILGESL